MMGNPFVTGTISITLGVLMLANVLMPTLKDTNTTGWSGAETSLWGVAGLAGVIGIVYGIFVIFGLV